LRWLIRLILAVVVSLSIAVVLIAFMRPQWLPMDKVPVIAGALAVLTSAIAAWTANRVVELTENELKPYPYPFFDTQSRTGLILLSITKFGGSTAHDVRLRWEEPLLNAEGNEVSFGPRNFLPVLLPKETTRVCVDVAYKFYQKYEEPNYSGEVEFKNSSGRLFRHRFYASAEKFRGTLLHEDEMSLTHGKLQTLPGILDDLTTEVRKISKELASQAHKPDNQPA
jgi:hypothetical protein